MIIAVGILTFMAICALSLVGLGQTHSQVSRMLNELDESRAHEQLRRQDPAPQPQDAQIDLISDPISEAAFTRSLLALGRAGLPVPYDSPTPARAESSSSVSVRRIQ